jgi:hypothetical protein
VRNLISVAEGLNRSWAERDDLAHANQKYAWRQIKDSYEGVSVAKGVFDARSKEDQYSHQNYEAVKIIDTLLSVFSYEELRAFGYDVNRSEHGKGASFIVFRNQSVEKLFDGEASFLSYDRILLAPGKQLRSKTARDTFLKIPAMSRREFEDYEALLLPYLVFRNMAISLDVHAGNAGDDRIDWEKVTDDTTGILAVAITEFSEQEYVEISRQVKNLESRSPQAVRDLTGFLMGMVFGYDKSFVGPMADVVKEKLPDIKRTAISFGSEYSALLERTFAHSPESFDRELALLPVTINVIETGGKQLPYAAEGRALRALKLQPRPGIVVTGGARDLSVDGPGHVTQAEQIADEILQVAIETKANVLIPGTAVGIGAVLARKYQEYMRGLPEDERENAPRFFAVEPGKNLYYPGNDAVDWEDKEIFAVTAVDAIVTPYHAGWSKCEDAETEQRRHNHYRQAIMNRISGRHGMVSVIANGGRWTLLENTEAAKEGFPVVSVGDSGRAGSLLNYLAQDETIYALQNDKERLLEYVIDLASSRPDHGEFAQTISQLRSNGSFRDDFFALIQSLKPGQLQGTSVGSLRDPIRSSLVMQEEAKKEVQR